MRQIPSDPRPDATLPPTIATSRRKTELFLKLISPLPLSVVSRSTDLTLLNRDYPAQGKTPESRRLQGQTVRQLHTLVRAFVHAHTHTHTLVHTRNTHLRTPTHTHTHTHPHTHTLVHMYTHTHLYTRICTLTHTRTHTYSYTHTHSRTHTHTYTPPHTPLPTTTGTLLIAFVYFYCHEPPSSSIPPAPQPIVI